MKFKTRGVYGAVFLLGLGTSFGAGYATRATQAPYPPHWRWPAQASEQQPLQRTADGNVFVQPVAASKNRIYKPDLKPYETLDEVRRAIKENFVRPEVDDTQLTYGAIRGMLRSLGDRFTRFLTPEDYTEFRVGNEGHFDGIGARIDVKDDYNGSPAAKPLGASRPYIVEPIAGGPAEKAGLQKNDVILTIDGRSTADMSEDVTVSYIRGIAGTPVKLKIERKTGSGKTPREATFNTFDVTLTRAVIEIHPVTLEWQPGNIAWLRLDEFNEKTDAEVGRALKEVAKGQDDNGPAKGLIFDMRENPGGLLNAAVDVGSRFIKTGPIVITHERTGAQKPYNAESDKFLGLKMPVVVLVDKFSASAAEIVTGALKDKGAATIVGEQTFGKASVQVLVDLKNGGALVITTAKYLTPALHDISDKGVAPDVVVAASPEDEKSMKGAQFQKAIEILKSKDGTAGAMTAKAE